MTDPTCQPVTDDQREAANCMAALRDVLTNLYGGDSSDEADFCNDLALALTDPSYRSNRLPYDAFDRIAAAILGGVS